jgi:hypothetical protein
MKITIALFCLVGVSAVVSFVIGAFVRSRVLTVVVSALVTESLLMTFFYLGIASSSDAPEIVGVPPLLAIVAAPIILFASFLGAALASRFRRRLESKFD